MMRFQELLAAASALSLLFVASVTPGASASLTEIAPDAARSSVYVSTSFLDKNTSTIKSGAVGGGFLVSTDGTVITAYHVIADWLKQDDEEKQVHPIILRIGSKYSSPHEASYLTGDSQADIALLRFREPQSYPTTALCYVTAMQSGSTLYGFGFPNDHDLTPVSGTFSNGNGENGRWEVAAPFTNGMSGGPVYNSSGFIVGLIQGGVPLSAATSFVTPLQWARPMLDARTIINDACSTSMAHAVKGMRLEVESVIQTKSRLSETPIYQGHQIYCGSAHFTIILAKSSPNDAPIRVNAVSVNTDIVDSFVPGAQSCSIDPLSARPYGIVLTDSYLVTATPRGTSSRFIKDGNNTYKVDDDNILRNNGTTKAITLVSGEAPTAIEFYVDLRSRSLQRIWVTVQYDQDGPHSQSSEPIYMWR